MSSSLTRSAVLPFICLVALSAPALTEGAQAPLAGTTDRVPARSPRTSDPTVAPADGRLGGLRGLAVDSSAGVLPGVTVVATSADGRPLSTTVTNTSGEFSFDGLPTGPVVVVFHLDGFGDSTTTVTIHPGGRAGPGNEERLVHRMDLAALAESVVVRGDPPAPPPPPRPVLVPVPPHDEASVCGPAKVEGTVPTFGTLAAGRSRETQGLFAADEEVVIDGGTLTGLAVGQNFVVRRQYRPAGAGGPDALMMGEHSSGLLQIVAVEAHSSTAVVVYVCDAMMAGDYLAAFRPEPIQAADPVGSPVFDLPARILFADAGQLLGVTHRMMVIDRGSQRGVRPGQRLTLFRRSRHGGSAPAVVGEAVVVAVRTYSATIRIEHATDAIFFGDGGDWAAPQQPAQGSRF